MLLQGQAQTGLPGLVGCRFLEQASGAMGDSSLSHLLPAAQPHQGSVSAEPALSSGSIPLPGTSWD